MEPGAGNGAIIRGYESAPVQTPDHRWIAIEKNASDEATLAVSAPGVIVEIGDFLDPRRPVLHSARAVVGNPPFILAEAFIRQARRCFPQAEIVLLLRVGFLASEERIGFWPEIGTPDLMVLPNRPSFTPDGRTDASSYAWFRWPVSPRTRGYTRILAATPKAIRCPPEKRLTPSPRS